MTFIAVIGTRHQFDAWAQDFFFKEKAVPGWFQIGETVFFCPRNEHDLHGKMLASYVVLPYAPGKTLEMARLAETARQRCRGTR